MNGRSRTHPGNRQPPTRSFAGLNPGFHYFRAMHTAAAKLPEAAARRLTDFGLTTDQARGEDPEPRPGYQTG